MPKRLSRNKLVLLCVAPVCIVGAGAVGALAAHSGKTHRGSVLIPKARAAAGFTAVTHGAYEFTRANGLNPADAQPAGTSSVLGALKVVRGNGVACVLHEEVDHCLSEELITQGRDVSVHTGCGTTERLMAIYGVAPPGTTAVRIAWSNNTTSEASLVNGVYSYDGTTPGSSGPYPTSIAWIGAGGTAQLTTAFPLKPSQFCPEG